MEGEWRRPTIHNLRMRCRHRAVALAAVATTTTTLKVPLKSREAAKAHG
jgi:hypothetical protein